MTSTTKTTTKTATKAEAAKLQADIDTAAAAHAAALADITQAEQALTAAKAEAARIDGLISSGDLTHGQPDSTNAHETARFAGLFLQGKKSKAGESDKSVRDAKLALLLADIEGSKDLAVDGLRADGLELAREISALIVAYRERGEVHNATRLGFIKRAHETNAYDGVNGYGDSSSRLVYSDRAKVSDARRVQAEVLILDGVAIEEEHAWNAVDYVLASAKVLAETPAEELAQFPGLVPLHHDYFGAAPSWTQLH